MSEGEGLRWFHTALLSVLAERGAITAARAGALVWTDATPREAASTAGPRLKELEARGLVRRLDDQRPIAWLRTPAGTKAAEPPPARGGGPADGGES